MTRMSGELFMGAKFVTNNERAGKKNQQKDEKI